MNNKKNCCDKLREAIFTSTARIISVYFTMLNRIYIVSTILVQWQNQQYPSYRHSNAKPDVIIIKKSLENQQLKSCIKLLSQTYTCNYLT